MTFNTPLRYPGGKARRAAFVRTLLVENRLTDCHYVETYAGGAGIAFELTIPSGDCLIWPFNLDLGHGVRLAWATAQPLTAINDGDVRTVFFAETEGVPAQFAFEKNGL